MQIAGLCHDLGHGPMSHMFDRHFIPRCRGPSCTWEHEAASAAMLDRLIADNAGMRELFAKHGLGNTEIHLIKVRGSCGARLPQWRRLRQCVFHLRPRRSSFLAVSKKRLLRGSGQGGVMPRRSSSTSSPTSATASTWTSWCAAQTSSTASHSIGTALTTLPHHVRAFRLQDYLARDCHHLVGLRSCTSRAAGVVASRDRLPATSTCRA